MDGSKVGGSVGGSYHGGGDGGGSSAYSSVMGGVAVCGSVGGNYHDSRAGHAGGAEWRDVGSGAAGHSASVPSLAESTKENGRRTMKRIIDLTYDSRAVNLCSKKKF